MYSDCLSSAPFILSSVKAETLWSVLSFEIMDDSFGAKLAGSFKIKGVDTKLVDDFSANLDNGAWVVVPEKEVACGTILDILPLELGLVLTGNDLSSGFSTDPLNQKKMTSIKTFNLCKGGMMMHTY